VRTTGISLRHTSSPFIRKPVKNPRIGTNINPKPTDVQIAIHFNASNEMVIYSMKMTGIAKRTFRST
jgi:hypothetical protein